MLGLFDGPKDAIIPERIEETSYTLEDNDFVEENIPASDGLPSLIIDLEQAVFPDMPIVNKPSVILNENGQFYPMKENEPKIYFQDEIPEFPSEPDFMAPHSD